MLNKVFLIGRLGGDPELKVSQTGTEVTNFSLAVYRAKDQTDWFRAVAFGEKAKQMCANCRKGNTIQIEGHLRVNTWERDGQKQERVEIVMDNFTSFAPPPRLEVKEESAEDNLPF